MYNNPQIHDQDSFYVVATRGPTTGALSRPGQAVYSGDKQPQFKGKYIQSDAGLVCNYR